MAKKKRVAKTDKYGVRTSSVRKGEGPKGYDTTRKYRSKSIQTLPEGDKGRSDYNDGRRGVVTRQRGTADRNTIARKTVNRSVNADKGTVKKTKYVYDKKTNTLKATKKEKTIGTKRATKKLGRLSSRQDRMDAKTTRKAARANRSPAIGRDVPLPKSK
jgi:hypothetical protein